MHIRDNKHTDWWNTLEFELGRVEHQTGLSVWFFEYMYARNGCVSAAKGIILCVYDCFCSPLMRMTQFNDAYRNTTTTTKHCDKQQQRAQQNSQLTHTMLVECSTRSGSLRDPSRADANLGRDVSCVCVFFVPYISLDLNALVWLEQEWFGKTNLSVLGLRTQTTVREMEYCIGTNLI